MSLFVRAFIAIQLSADLTRRLGELQQRLKSTLRDPAMRWTRPEQIHLTLIFLGEVSVVELPELEAALRHAVKTTKPFSLRAETLGCFPNVERPRVLWTGISGDTGSLETLQSAVVNETARFAEANKPPSFSPHLTIARIKDASGHLLRELAGVITNSSREGFGEWPIAHVELIRSELSSQGARYTTLAKIPF